MMLWPRSGFVPPFNTSFAPHFVPLIFFYYSSVRLFLIHSPKLAPLS